MMDNGTTLKNELCDLKKVRDNFVENKDQHTDAKRDTKNTSIVNWIKVRMIQKCDECETPWCFFLLLCTRICQGTNILMLYRDILRQMDISVEIQFKFTTVGHCKWVRVRKANLCGTVVKAQYYASKTIRVKEREFTPNTFAVIVILKERERERERGEGGGRFILCADVVF